MKRRLKIIFKQLIENLDLVKDEPKTAELKADTFTIMIDPVSNLVYDFAQFKDVIINYDFDLIDKIVE